MGTATGVAGRPRPPGPAVAVAGSDRRPVSVLVAVTVAIAVVLLLSAAIGEYSIRPADVVRAVLGRRSATGEDHTFIVNALRIPRALVAVGVGCALGLSGVLLQAITRNPLAAPSILGITQGAGLAAVLLVVAAPAGAAVLLPVAAFSGATVAALLVYGLAWRGGASPARLVLIGVAVAALAAALTTVVITFGNIYRVQSALVWLVGSVRARGWPEFWTLLPWLALLFPVTLWSARSLDALGLGDAVARGLGVHVERRRGLLLLVSVALAGAAVSVAGTVGFVGLMAPHLARRLVGPAHGALLPTAALLGGLIVAAADLTGRTVLAPVEVPCGIVTAILGAPYFVYLLYRGGVT